MQPDQLTADQFSGYPPQARQLAVSRLDVLRQLPLAFLPLLLRELIAYDWKFPAERRDLDNQLAYLSAKSSQQLSGDMTPFANLRLSPELAAVNWAGEPAQFSERLTAHLWATHQIDAFRAAAIEYVHKVNAAATTTSLPVPRLAIVVIGAGVEHNSYPLFRKLRAQGVYFTGIDPRNGWNILMETIAARAVLHPLPFEHWYIDGGAGHTPVASGVTCVFYDALAGVRNTLVNKMRAAMQPGGGGPEVLRSMLAQMRPADVGLADAGDAAVLSRFQVSILTEGSGTQLFSTTFVQWSAREALRRAQPVTLLARFTPRQREQSMKDLLAGIEQSPVPDPEGSLIDADMAAYYTWINQQRLAGAAQSSFLVWFENHNEALAIAPALPRGKTDDSAIDMRALMRRLA